MNNKLVKVCLGVITTLLTITTSAYASYKIIKNNTNAIKVLGTQEAQDVPTPEIHEVEQEVLDIVMLPTATPTPTSFISPLPTSYNSFQSSKLGTSQNSLNSTPIATAASFNDFEDDEVEFEEHFEDSKKVKQEYEKE